MAVVPSDGLGLELGLVLSSTHDVALKAVKKTNEVQRVDALELLVTGNDISVDFLLGEGRRDGEGRKEKGDSDREETHCDLDVKRVWLWVGGEWWKLWLELWLGRFVCRCGLLR